MEGVATDLELLERWSEGDQASGNVLFERYFNALFRFFRNKVQYGVEDLIQQTLLACVEGRARFRGEASFRTYVFQVARFQLYAHYRSRYRGAELDFEITGVADLGTTPTGALARKQEELWLLEGLRRIPLQYQIVLELSVYEDLPGREIAQILEIPEGTMRSRLRVAAERLRKELLLISDGGCKLAEPEEDLEGWARRVRERFGHAVGDGAA
jgi:RNA polymerase sigma factor (sigma-70 family)